MLQNATPLKKSALWPRNISDEHVSCTATATENASLQILLKCPRPADAFETATKPSRFAHFGQGAEPPCACHTKRHFNVQKRREHVVLCAFWLRNARCNGVHFLNISTSKSGPNLSVFNTFDFEMCFAPQRRAIVHLWSGQMAQRAYFSTLRSHKSLEKHSESRLSYLFRAPASSFFWLFLFADLLFSDSAHLCFSISPYCRKFDF